MKLYVENSVAQATDVPPEIFQLLRHDLRYTPAAAYTPETNSPGPQWLFTERNTFPSGLLPNVQRLLSKYAVPFELKDLRERPREDLPLHSKTIQLRPYQKKLVDRALEIGRGVLDAPPRSGKTMMGASIIDQNPLPFLWTAPTLAIVRQTVRALKRLLPLGQGDDGVLDVTGGWPQSIKGQRAAHHARVVVTTMASAVKFPESFYRTRKGYLADEWHHHAADTGQEINRLASPIFHRYGLTGTYFRSDPGTEIRMHALLSDVIGKVTVRELVDLGYLVPANIVFIPISEPMLPPGLSRAEAYERGIVHNPARNAWVSWAASTLAASGRRVIVLVKHIVHGEILAKEIQNSTFVQGEDGEDVTKAIDLFNAGKIQILIGTSVLGEGIDLPAADALVYAKGGSASVTVTQDFFRVLTGAEGKYPAIIVDFADRHQEHLLAQASKRGSIYAREDAFNTSVASWRDPERDLRPIFAPITLLR